MRPPATCNLVCSSNATKERCSRSVNGVIDTKNQDWMQPTWLLGALQQQCQTIVELDRGTLPLNGETALYAQPWFLLPLAS